MKSGRQYVYVTGEFVIVLGKSKQIDSERVEHEARAFGFGDAKLVVVVPEDFANVPFDRPVLAPEVYAEYEHRMGLADRSPALRRNYSEFVEELLSLPQVARTVTYSQAVNLIQTTHFPEPWDRNGSELLHRVSCRLTDEPSRQRMESLKKEWDQKHGM